MTGDAAGESSATTQETELLDIRDRLELHELAARYGDLVDARDWAGLSTVFTADAVFAFTDASTPELRGLSAIQAFMDATELHPLAHLIVNVRVLPGPPVVLRSRVLAILADRRVGSGWYVDRVVRTEQGWRISDREFTALGRGIRGPAAL